MREDIGRAPGCTLDGYMSSVDVQPGSRGERTELVRLVRLGTEPWGDSWNIRERHDWSGRELISLDLCWRGVQKEDGVDGIGLTLGNHFAPFFSGQDEQEAARTQNALTSLERASGQSHGSMDATALCRAPGF